MDDIEKKIYVINTSKITWLSGVNVLSDAIFDNVEDTASLSEYNSKEEYPLIGIITQKTLRYFLLEFLKESYLQFWKRKCYHENDYKHCKQIDDILELFDDSIANSYIFSEDIILEVGRLFYRSHMNLSSFEGLYNYLNHLMDYHNCIIFGIKDSQVNLKQNIYKLSYVISSLPHEEERLKQGKFILDYMKKNKSLFDL